MTQATTAPAARGVLREVPDRRLENDALSNLVRSDSPGSLRAMVRWVCEDSAWRAWGGLGYSVKTGQPAFDHIIGRELFDHFKDHSEAAQVFNEAMIRLIVEQVVTDRPGRERTDQEFARLLHSAGLTMTRIVPTESVVCIVEAVTQ